MKVFCYLLEIRIFMLGSVGKSVHLFLEVPYLLELIIRWMAFFGDWYFIVGRHLICWQVERLRFRLFYGR